MKRGPGRPKIKDRKQAKADTLTIRLTHLEKMGYEKAAKARGLKLAEWIRQTLAVGAGLGHNA